MQTLLNLEVTLTHVFAELEAYCTGIGIHAGIGVGKSDAHGKTNLLRQAHRELGQAFGHKERQACPLRTSGSPDRQLVGRAGSGAANSLLGWHMGLAAGSSVVGVVGAGGAVA